MRTVAGDPIADAHVQGHASHTRTGKSPHARTDADGAFAMGGVEAVTYRLYATAPGFARAEATVEYGVLCKLDGPLATKLYYLLGGR